MNRKVRIVSTFVTLMAITFSLAIINSMLTPTAYAQDQYSFLMKWGNSGRGIGSFSQPLEIAIDSNGYVHVAGFGENNRITRFDGDGNLINEWGTPGTYNGQFTSSTEISL